MPSRKGKQQQQQQLLPARSSGAPAGRTASPALAGRKRKESAAPQPTTEQEEEEEEEWDQTLCLDPSSGSEGEASDDSVEGGEEEEEEEQVILSEGEDEDKDEQADALTARQEERLLAAEKRYLRRQRAHSDSGFSSSASAGAGSASEGEGKARGLVVLRKPARPDIEAVYHTDSSDEETENTVGNIPMEWYDDMPHIGYDVNGRKIFKPLTKDALDAFLDNVDGPHAGKTVHDELSGKDVVLSPEELRMIQRIHRHAYPDAAFDPYQQTIEWFTSQTEVMPVSAAPEPKRRFVPSKHEAARIMRIARAIRKGLIVPGDPNRRSPQATKTPTRAGEWYGLWEDHAPERPPHVMHIPAPKMKLPGHNASYNPPAEYLLDEEEKAALLAQDPEDRALNFLPHKYPNLRSVPGYGRFIQERFDRCLDLYLCPRTVKKRLDIDPESLIPNLPAPKDLRPFPTQLAISYRGHEGRVRSVSVDPSGQLLASGGDDGYVRVWEVTSGKCLQAWKLPNLIARVAWNPNPAVCMLACTWEHQVTFLVPERCGGKRAQTASALLQSLWSTAPPSNGGTEQRRPPCQWVRPSREEEEQGIRLHLAFEPSMTLTSLVFHRKGDYFATLCPTAGSANASILIHQLSRRTSQNPFARVKGGTVTAITFHPTKPIFFVATQRYVRVYHLMRQELLKTLQTGAKWISSLAVHPQGDNVIVGTYDKRLNWFDMDLSTKPFKTLRYHTQAIRDVAMSPVHPLFASASDDGTINLFHGMVYNDLMKNPLIVPVKQLRAHVVLEGGLGVLGLAFHPQQPWIFSCGADGGVHLFC